MIAVARDTWTRERTESEEGQSLEVVDGSTVTVDVALPPERASESK